MTHSPFFSPDKDPMPTPPVAEAIRLARIVQTPATGDTRDESYPTDVREAVTGTARSLIGEAVAVYAPSLAALPEPTPAQQRLHRRIIENRGDDELALIPNEASVSGTFVGADLCNATLAVDVSNEPEPFSGSRVVPGRVTEDSALYTLFAARTAAMTPGLRLDANDFLGEHSPDPVERVLRRLSRVALAHALPVIGRYRHVGRHRA